MFINPMI